MNSNDHFAYGDDVMMALGRLRGIIPSSQQLNHPTPRYIISYRIALSHTWKDELKTSITNKCDMQQKVRARASGMIAR